MDDFLGILFFVIVFSSLIYLKLKKQKKAKEKAKRLKTASDNGWNRWVSTRTYWDDYIEEKITLEAAMALKALEEKEAADKRAAYIDSLKKIYGDVDTERILAGEVWQGMSKDMLIKSQGNPEEEDEKVYKDKTKLKCYYDSYRTKRKTTKYRKRIDLENGLVVGWEDGDFRA